MKTKRKAVDHKTGYYVWVGAEKRWFRHYITALAGYSESVRIYGEALVQIDDCATRARVR